MPVLPSQRGERLGNEEHLRDFRARDAAIRGGKSWKLERLQHFEEVGSPSRDALRRGDWWRLSVCTRRGVRTCAGSRRMGRLVARCFIGCG